MNKTRKGLLMATSIIAIIGSVFAIFGSLIFFLIGGFFTEKELKETYLTDEAYIYVEEPDGSYYFKGYDEDGIEIIVEDEEIKTLANIVSTIFIVAGVVVLGVSVAKLALAIRVLIFINRNKYPKGNVIALLVLSILNTSIIEIALLIIAMCQKDEDKPVEDNSTKQLTIDDLQ